MQNKPKQETEKQLEALTVLIMDEMIKPPHKRIEVLEAALNRGDQ